MIPNKILDQNNRNQELIKLYKEKYYKDIGIELRSTNNNNQDNQQDLGVFSKKKFKKGDVVLSNIQPYVWSVSQHNIVCDYCLKSQFNENTNTKIALKRCTGCKLIHYCSIECQKSAWSIHKHECKILSVAAQESLKIKKPLNTKSTVMLLRIFIKRNLEFQQQQSNNCSNNDKTGQFEIIDYLLNHKQVRINDDYKSFSIGICQQLNEDLSKAPIVLEYLLKLEPNCINIPKCEASSIGLYPLMVFFNHSCKSNLSILNNGKELKIICNRDINENEELSINYNPTISSDIERRMMLKECFYFNCKCELCCSKDGQSIYSNILCQKCKQGMVNIRIDKKVSNCSKCLVSYSPEEVTKRYSSTIESYDKLKDQLENQNSKFNVQEFKLLLNQYCKEFHFSNPLFYSIVNSTDLFYQDFKKDTELPLMKHFHQRYQALLKYHLLEIHNLEYEYCQQLLDYSNTLVQIGYFKDAHNILVYLNQTLSKINYYGFNKDYLISIQNELEFNINVNNNK